MSSEHFKGKYEVELKYRVRTKTDFLQVLSSLSHEVMLLDNTETDWYFDTPEHSLAAQNKSVSIREMEPSGIKLWIVKGPEADRCEATNITDAKAAKSMLATMGYEPYLVMKKVRSIYFVDQYHITLDFLDGIGHFAEFAIMTDDETLLARYKGELEQLASQFGLTEEDLEHRSYRTLYQMQSTL